MERLNLIALAFTVFACANEPQLASDEPIETAPAMTGDDLPLGDVDGLKADGSWGAATTCKAIPVLTPLADPAITVSLDGLTLHLVDRQGTYDKVFPIGPGAIEDFKSLTPVSTSAPGGVFWARGDATPVQDGPTAKQAVWGWSYSCRMWWTDDKGQKSPVFAGLPFIRLDGAPGGGYGIHGPIDQFTLPTGGNLRRGFVSHGCVRMAAADIVEVFALIQGHKTPVRIQKAIEMTEAHVAVDIADRWLLGECASDSDCAFPGGFCKLNHWSGRGFCTASCTGACPDRAGQPTSFCVTDPDDVTKGICTLKPAKTNNGCRRFDGFSELASVKRFGSTKKSPACLPGTEGWVGDTCFANADCTSGACEQVDGGPVGVCVKACTASCSDQAGGFASTFCVKNPLGNGGICTARCSNNDDCSQGTTCEAEPKNGQSGPTKTVCLPY